MSKQNPMDALQSAKLDIPADMMCLAGNRDSHSLILKKQLVILENYYNEFYELAPIGYFDVDEHNYIVKTNLTGARLFGIPRSRLENIEFSIFIAKNYQSVFHLILKRALQTKIKQSCELEFLKSDGSSFYSLVECIAAIDLAQNKTCARLSIIDISKYHYTEQALQLSEGKFRSIVETTKAWVWSIDVRGRYFYSNPTVETILGYSVDEIMQRNRLLLIHKDDRSIVTKMMPVLIKCHHGWSDLVLRYHCKNGGYCYLESNAMPYFSYEGKLLGFHGSDRDVTARKYGEMQTRQHQTASYKVSKMNSLSELASILAHELTQPLTAINNFITGCIKRLELGNHQNSDLLEALQQASQQAERAGQIIHRMKNFARRGKLYFEEIDINEVIHSSIILIKKEFPSTNVKIYFEPANLFTPVMGDQIQLQQVMLNLMRNGIEAMTESNTLKPTLKIKYRVYSNQYISVSVSDNGSGFSENRDMNKLFESYFTTKSTGLGVGLAISRTIIEAHNGRLMARENLHRSGACFQFTLPITRPSKNVYGSTLGCK